MSQHKDLDKMILTIAANDLSPAKSEGEFVHARYGDAYNERIEHLQEEGYIDIDSITLPASNRTAYKIQSITPEGAKYLKNM